MKAVLLAAVLSAWAACGGDGALTAPTCSVVKQSYPDTPCVYQLPSGQVCADTAVKVDGVALLPNDFSVVCDAGQIAISDKTKCGSPHVVEACF